MNMYLCDESFCFYSTASSSGVVPMVVVGHAVLRDNIGHYYRGPETTPLLPTADHQQYLFSYKSAPWNTLEHFGTLLLLHRRTIKKGNITWLLGGGCHHIIVHQGNI